MVILGSFSMIAQLLDALSVSKIEGFVQIVQIAGKYQFTTEHFVPDPSCIALPTIWLILKSVTVVIMT